MMDTITTTDLTKFGYRELDMAADLLKAYAAQPPDFLSDGVTVMFNTRSGNVFLTDEDCGVAMLNNGKLEQWHNCYYCGAEGFADDFNDGHRFDSEGTINCPEEENRD